LEGVRGCLGSIPKSELAEDVADVVSCRLRADHLPVGDLGVRESLREKREHLALPAREVAAIAGRSTSFPAE
jgi:hypothetical protein